MRLDPFSLPAELPNLRLWFKIAKLDVNNILAQPMRANIPKLKDHD